MKGILVAEGKMVGVGLRYKVNLWLMYMIEQGMNEGRVRKGTKQGKSKDCLRGDGSRGIERCGALAIR
jgi:hypothetical protein